jgi:hypothetical protein
MQGASIVLRSVRSVDASGWGCGTALQSSSTDNRCTQNLKEGMASHPRVMHWVRLESSTLIQVVSAVRSSCLRNCVKSSHNLPTSRKADPLRPHNISFLHPGRSFLSHVIHAALSGEDTRSHTVPFYFAGPALRRVTGNCQPAARSSEALIRRGRPSERRLRVGRRVVRAKGAPQSVGRRAILAHRRVTSAHRRVMWAGPRVIPARRGVTSVHRRVM